MARRYSHKLETLAKQNYVDNYYQNPQDFKGNVFYKLSNISLVDMFNQIHHNVRLTPSQRQIFYQHYKGTNRHVIFTQASSSLQQAINDYVIWNTKGYLDETPNVVYDSLMLFDIPSGQWYSSGELTDNTPFIIKYDTNTFMPILMI